LAGGVGTTHRRIRTINPNILFHRQITNFYSRS
jgi:hypothetical protein